MEDRTQQIGQQPAPPVGPGANEQMNRTVIGGPGIGQPGLGGPDLGRTTMGAPMRALDLEVMAGSRLAFAPERTREHLLLQIRANSSAIGRRMPLNVCLVIDRSGSMEGEPLEYVKRACAYVVDLLEATDVLSIVTFEEQVDVLMPARRVVNRALIKEHINRIQAGNTTNLYDGMLAGCMQVASLNAPGYLNRVLLLTDGEPTSGIKDFASIVGQVQEQRNRGISITALGFGAEYNEELMAGIARRGGGNYYYIAQPMLIPEVFRKELETLMTITAKNVHVRINLPRGVQCRYVYGIAQPKVAARTVEFDLADIERGKAVSNLSELEFDRHVPGTYRVAKVDVTYDDAVSGRTETLTADAVLEFTTDRSGLEAAKNPTVQSELEVHLASRNLEKTMMGMRTQQLNATGAMQELQRTRSVLQQAGRTEQAREVTLAMEQLQQGGQVEKTLIGTIYNLDQGKK